MPPAGCPRLRVAGGTLIRGLGGVAEAVDRTYRLREMRIEFRLGFQTEIICLGIEECACGHPVRYSKSMPLFGGTRTALSNTPSEGYGVWGSPFNLPYSARWDGVRASIRSHSGGRQLLCQGDVNVGAIDASAVIFIECSDASVSHPPMANTNFTKCDAPTTVLGPVFLFGLIGRIPRDIRNRFTA